MLFVCTHLCNTVRRVSASLPVKRHRKPHTRQVYHCSCHVDPTGYARMQVRNNVPVLHDKTPGRTQDKLIAAAVPLRRVCAVLRRRQVNQSKAAGTVVFKTVPSTDKLIGFLPAALA